MSTICAEIMRVAGVKPHPNADRLDIVTVGGAESATVRGKFKVGDLSVFFPPNLLIPETVATALKVANYLKHSIFPGDKVKSRCRVAACRIRCVPSFGFVVSLEDAAEAVPTVELTNEFVSQKLYWEPGFCVDTYFGATKYTPPERSCHGGPDFMADAAPEHPCFHEYTDIQNFYKYPDAIAEGTPVRITEKIHGTNARMGLIRTDDAPDGSMDFSFMCGSHHRNLKPVTAAGETPLWWQYLTEPIANLLTHLCDEKHSVILFGEIYGPSVQDMDYGCSREEPGFRVFDISVNGRYLDWDKLHTACVAFGVPTAPLLYVGPFNKEALDEHTYGATQVSAQVAAKFKDREGCVVTPLKESFSADLYGRTIVKSVSADYLDRKNAQDNA